MKYRWTRDTAPLRDLKQLVRTWYEGEETKLPSKLVHGKAKSALSLDSWFTHALTWGYCTWAYFLNYTGYSVNSDIAPHGLFPLISTMYIMLLLKIQWCHGNSMMLVITNRIPCSYSYLENGKLDFKTDKRSLKWAKTKYVWSKHGISFNDFLSVNDYD